MITAVWQLGVSFFMPATFPSLSSGCIPSAGFLVKHTSFVFPCQCWPTESQPVWGIFLLAGNPDGRNSCRFTTGACSSPYSTGKTNKWLSLLFFLQCNHFFFFFFQGPEQKSVCFRSYYCVWNSYQAVSSSLNCFFLVLRVQAEFYIANL